MKWKLTVLYNRTKGGGLLNICEFGDIFKSLRKSHNLTQAELGSKVGLSKAAISKYETGIGFPTFDVLIRIADYFGVTTDYLLGVAKGKTVDVSLLTDSQIEIIHRIIAEFNSVNKK